MKSMRGLMGVTLAMLWLATNGAKAQWGAYSTHSVTGSRGSWVMHTSGGNSDAFTVDVGAGCNYLLVETGTDGHGGYGNCNLYVRLGALPTATDFTRRSVRLNYQDRIIISRPPAGRYFIRLYGQSRYRTCLKIVTRESANSGALSLVNWERVIRGASRLTLSSRLTLAADRHANEMFDHEFFSHTGLTTATRTPARRIAATGYRFRLAVEAISKTPGGWYSVISKWMKNTTDRANLLNPNMRQAGFAGYYDENNPSFVRLVAVFAQPR